MQTLRKKSSPCKYKNDPSRFLGEGITFKAKLIGILEVNEARGDKMCQDALNDLKTAIRAAGEHKQRITISIAIDGLRLRDEKTGDCMYHHPVHKISFIAQDMSDSRAFGYIFGSPDTGHRFFGIKTDKTASQVVIAMRDLFQVVFELKKKEIEMAKHHIEQHQMKYGGSSYNDSLHSTKDDLDSDKKGKYPPLLKTSCITSAPSEASTSGAKANTSEAIADLLDLEHELNSIQQGINQMERITPSDPFGPLSKGDPFLDPFDDSFPPKAEKTTDVKVPPPTTSTTSTKSQSSLKNRTPSQSSSKDSGDVDRSSSMFGSAASTSSKTHFFSQFSPSITKSKLEDNHWFDQETESLFNDTTNVNNAEPTSSPVTFHTPTADPEQPLEDRKSPVKADVFTELDPLGTGRVKPYVDKKDFFQELKNPPKKVLKELITETSSNESTHYFPSYFDSNKSPQNSSNLNSTKEPSVIKNTLANASSNILNSFPSKDSSGTSKYSRIDPFEDTDPFEKTDPFLEENFPQSIGFPPLFSGGKNSFDGVFQDKNSKYEKVPSKNEEKMSPAKSSYFSTSMSSSLHGPLRVSLPPEKFDNPSPLSISTITSKFRSSPSPPEEPKSHRRRHYQSLKQSTDDRGDECCQSPIHDEIFPKSPKFGKSEKRSPYKDRKSYFTPSPPPTRYERTKSSYTSDLLETTPDPPPRPKQALFSIKPPPLPPKKQNQPTFKPPARPPSIEDNAVQYDYIKNQEEALKSRFEFKEEPRSPKRDIIVKPNELRKQNSDVGMSTSFPILPPPPQRKASADSNKNIDLRSQSDNKLSSPNVMKKQEDGSILNITLNQLDKSGLENLAVTLGIPSENIYNMTLQELTKRLAQKYLGTSDTNTEKTEAESFQADFEANFNKTESKSGNNPDKYAVFRELIENENKKLGDEKKTDEGENNVTEAENNAMEIMRKEEEDRYAALRQLSLSAQKSENLSEELDVSNEDDSSARGDNISDILRHHTEDSFTPVNMEMGNDSPITKSSTSDWPTQPSEEKKEEAEIVLEKAEETAKREEEPKENTEKVPEKKEEPVENWATFEKAPSFEEIAPAKPEETENSPFSSDGKEDVKEVPFNWHQKIPRRKHKDVPWHDEDESWDDYSPKESYWSDESSHDDRSPDKREGRYHRRSWNKHSRMKSPPKPEQWHRRDKWHEDTEDEYDESWRKHRCRKISCEGDRKDVWDVNEYDGYEKQFDWCNSRNEPWDENERYRCYERRKRSESDDEYRRRCDSDTSDREYVWTFKRNYPETFRNEKQKQYYMASYSRDYAERGHESRSKHKKGGTHKRPSSASETKRNYEKMYSPVDQMPRSMDKVPLGKRESEEEDFSPRYHPSHKDARYYFDFDSGHHYNSYDRRSQTMHPKRMIRSSRIESTGSIQNEIFSPPPKIEDKIDPKEKPFHYFPPEPHQNHRNRKPPEEPIPEKPKHFQFEDDFAPTSFDRPALQRLSNQSPKRDVSKSPRRKRFDRDEWTSNNKSKTNEDSFFQSDNNNENFANFNEEFKSSPKKIRENQNTKGEGGVILPKPHMKGKNHFSMLNRQDSSASLRKSESINIFSRENDPFEDDDFFSSAAANNAKLNRFTSEKSKSNSNVSDPFTWKEVFGDSNFQE